jgi:stress response protein YsnF
MRMGDTETGEFRGHSREQEVVTDKRAVVKEEIRLRKDVVQDEEVVEEDVRKEEVDIDDATERRDR